MAYWHQDERGRWYFDWSHILPVLPLVLYGVGAALYGFWRLLTEG